MTKRLHPFQNKQEVVFLVHTEPVEGCEDGFYIVKPKDNSYKAIWNVIWGKPIKIISTEDGYTKEEVDKIISTIKDYQKENDKLLENIKLEISKLNSKKADRTELANVVAGLVPMGSVANLAELETKPKRSNDAYYVEDQLSPEGNAYIYRWDAGLNLWVNTKQVVFKYVITQGLGDSSNKVMSQKAVTEELGKFPSDVLVKSDVQQELNDSSLPIASNIVYNLPFAKNIFYSGVEQSVLSALSKVSIYNVRRLPYNSITPAFKRTNKLYIVYINVVANIATILIRSEQPSGVSTVEYKSELDAQGVAYFNVKSEVYELYLSVNFKEKIYLNLQNESDLSRIPYVIGEVCNNNNKYLFGPKSEFGYIIEDVEIVGDDLLKLKSLSISAFRNDKVTSLLQVKINGVITNSLSRPLSTNKPFWYEYSFNESLIRILIRLDYIFTSNLTFSDEECYFDIDQLNKITDVDYIDLSENSIKNRYFISTSSEKLADYSSDFWLLVDLQTDLNNEICYIISKGATAYTHKGYAVILDKNIIKLTVQDVSVEHVITDTNIHRYIFTKDSSGLKVYCDGLLTRSILKKDLSTTNTLPLALFAYSFNNEQYNVFKGKVGQISMSSGTLSKQLLNNLSSMNITEKIPNLGSNIIIYPYLLTERSFRLQNNIYPVSVYNNQLAQGRRGNLRDQFFSQFENSVIRYDRVLDIEKQMPLIANVGAYEFIRNNNDPNKTVLDNYTLNNNYPALSKSDILETIITPILIKALDKYGFFYGISDSNRIVKTLDAGLPLAEWEEVIVLENVRISDMYILNNSELLLLADTYTVNNNTVLGGLYVTADNRKKYIKSYTFSNQYQYHSYDWNVEITDDFILFSEYGNSYNKPESPVIGVKADATRIFISRDSGVTFNLLVNLNDLSNLYPGNGGLHIHSVHYDVFWNRIWVTTGDGGALKKSNKKLIWSDNMGETWDGIELSQYYEQNIRELGGTPYDNLQGLSMYSTPQCLLIGSDCWRQGIYRVNKFNRNKILLEDAYRLPINNDITHFTGRFVRYGSSEPILVPFARGDAATAIGKVSRQPFILATFDGVNFYKIWEDLNLDNIAQAHFRIFNYLSNYYFPARNKSGQWLLYKMHLKY